MYRPLLARNSAEWGPSPGIVLDILTRWDERKGGSDAVWFLTRKTPIQAQLSPI